MRSGPLFTLIILLVSFPLLCTAQSKQTGPVIPTHGAVWPVENPDYKTRLDEPLKVVFDIMESPDSPDQINARIETAARFLNMHAQAGVPTENLKVALIVHNKASKDIIKGDAYRERFGVENPNEQLVNDLLQAGVQVVFCGQSSLSRGFPRTETIEGVQLGLSAMTALIQFQNDGYRLVKF